MRFWCDDSMSAHGFSASAREKIEGAGGTVVALREPKVVKAKPAKATAAKAKSIAPNPPISSPMLVLKPMKRKAAVLAMKAMTFQKDLIS